MPAAAVAQHSPNWSGYYVGSDLGYVQAQINDFVRPAQVASHNDTGGLIGGLHAGYRHQMPNNIVMGIEGDLWGAGDVSGFAVLFAPNETFTKLKWGGSVRGVFGGMAAETLLYTTFGVAFAETEGCVTWSGTTVCQDRSIHAGINWGWTGGFGVARMLSEHVIIRLEYLHADYATKSLRGDLFRMDLKTDTIRAGVSWRFSTSRLGG